LLLWAPLAAATSGEPAAPSQPATIASAQTQRMLQTIGLRCPIIDVDRLKKQVHFLVRKKHVTPPPSVEQNEFRLPAEDKRRNESRATKETLPSLVPLRVAGSARPLFCMHGLGGHVAALMPLAQGLSGDRPMYGLQAQGLDAGQEPHDRIETMAAWYVKEIRDVQPQGPYLLGGWSLGGLIALEAAQQLLVAGQVVTRLAMFDTYLSLKDFPLQELDETSVLHRIALQLNVPLAALKNLPLEQQWDRIAELAHKASGIGIAEIRRLAAACRAHLRALARYVPRPYAGSTALFAAEDGRSGLDRRWKTVCPSLCIEPVPGDHFSMLHEPHVQVLARRLGRFLQESDTAGRMAHRAGLGSPSTANPQEFLGGDERKARP
jgi:thioesterase domain-containing protein